MAMQAAMKATARPSKAMKSAQATVKSAMKRKGWIHAEKAKVQSSKAMKSSAFAHWSLYNVREDEAIWVATTITCKGKVQVKVFGV